MEEINTSDIIREDMRQFQANFEAFLQQQNTSLTNLHQNHKELVAKHIAQTTLLQEQSSNLTKVLEKQHEQGKIEKGKAEKLRMEVEQLEAESKALPVDVAQIREKHQSKLKQIQKEQEAVEEIEKEKNSKIEELTKAVVCYRENLGLEFVSVKGVLNIQFKYIDHNNPEKIFSFALDVDENNNYVIMNCSPEGGNTDTVVDKLNENNNFAYFIHSMRRRFKSTVTTRA